MAEDSYDNSGTPKKEDVKLFTQEDVNKYVSERVNEINAKNQKAIEEMRAQHDADTQALLEKAKAEWEEAKRMESLTGQEKMQAEYNAKLTKAQKEQDSLNKELQKIQTELAISKAQAQLASLNLPPQFADKMIGKDDAETSQNIQAFDAMVKELVAKMVNENVARGTPKLGNAEATRPVMQDKIAAAMGVKSA